MSDGAYTQDAEDHLDALETGPDPRLYNAVLDVVELILTAPGTAQAVSSAVWVQEGVIVMRMPVPGYGQYKVFWSTGGPTIRAVIRHPG